MRLLIQSVRNQLLRLHMAKKDVGFCSTFRDLGDEMSGSGHNNVSWMSEEFMSTSDDGLEPGMDLSALKNYI